MNDEPLIDTRDHVQGISLRDQLAMMWAKAYFADPSRASLNLEGAAKIAYRFADAMLAERAK